MGNPEPCSGQTDCAPGMQPASELAALEERIGDCRRCDLFKTRTSIVFGVGDPCARLMFVGEAPGRNEDLKGEPFVGAAGRFLDELLASIGLSRSDVYIANVLKCRPPGNRDPLPEEISACAPFLEEQVRIIDPEVIATLGKHATKHVLNTDRPISALRGRLFDVDGRSVVPIYHPAAALYDRTKAAVLFDDFKRLKAVLEKCMGRSEPASLTRSSATSTDASANASGEGASEDQGSDSEPCRSSFEQPPLF